MKILSKYYLSLSLLAVFVLLLTSCDKDRNKPGHSYFPDMEQSRSYETYSQNPVLEGGNTNMMPVENTMPRGIIPYDFEKTQEDRVLAGKMLHNPYEGESNNEEILKEGKRKFNIYCVDCHGDLGDGKGFLFTSGKYPYPPASILSDRVVPNPDGEIFHVISVGFGVMGAHQGQIKPDDRWKIITYIRNELMVKK